MTKIDQSKLYSTQISLSEWFENLGHSQIEEMRQEDNDKRERLAVLNEILGLPFDKPTQFPATALANGSPEFKEFLKIRGTELCALRLIPRENSLPKLRLRGITIKDSLRWFSEQNIDPEKYKADFIPHGEKQQWSTIFIVNPGGIFGEITKGGHYQLTQGFYDEGEPITFSYDFKNWHISSDNPKIEEYLKNIISKVKVADIKDRQTLIERLDSTFTNYYLNGYFETVDTEEFGIWFVDYNRFLGNLYSNFSLSQQSNQLSIIKGSIGSSGKTTGRVKIIFSQNLDGQTINSGEILVCDMTTPNFLPLMQKSSAIITDFGGILSHAAIVARELKIPCITNTKNATQVLKNGDLIEIDTDLGTIKYVN